MCHVRRSNLAWSEAALWRTAVVSRSHLNPFLLGHDRELRSISPDVCHLMRGNQMICGVDGDLNGLRHLGSWPSEDAYEFSVYLLSKVSRSLVSFSSSSFC